MNICTIRSCLPRYIFTRSIMNNPSVTAAIIVIGDEILKGYTVDTNSNFLCKRLRRLGVSVERISVIPDNVEIIAEEVRKCSEKYTHVLTSGGIGPTHDDMTFEGVAKAMDDHTMTNKELSAIVEKYFGKQENDSTPAMKLALIPSKSQLIWGTDKKGRPGRYPVVAIANVTVLPGVPQLLEKGFDLVEERFRNPNSKFYGEKIYVTLDEVSIADMLTDVAKKYEGRVNLGSYPVIGHSYYRVKLTLDSTDENSLKEAMADLLRLLPAARVIDFDETPEKDIVSKLDKYLTRLASKEPEFQKKIADSIAIIEEAFRKYKWEEISVAFNGGKDCTALLHLVDAVACKQFPSVQSARKLKALYLRPRLPFDEMEQFIEEGRLRYDLDLVTSRGSIKEALFDFTASHKEIRAVFMGTRTSDPNSHLLEAWAKTDPGWPELMRISPLINWTYDETWRFLRDLQVPYCHLYDDGYTSLGNKDNTEKNPSLAYVDNMGLTRYRPAYMLQNAHLERDGRKNGV